MIMQRLKILLSKQWFSNHRTEPWPHLLSQVMRNVLQCQKLHLRHFLSKLTYKLIMNQSEVQIMINVCHFVFFQNLGW